MKKLSYVKKNAEKFLSNSECEKIRTHFFRHLQTPLGTLENYPDKHTIETIFKERPAIIDEDEVRRFTQSKINSFISLIYKEIFIERKKLHINPMILKMIKNHIEGKDDMQNLHNGHTFVIQNWFPTANSGKHTPPEPKSEILDVDH